ncbi:MAG TPA: hypothetical protein PLP42_18980, partial [Acidobacteriota bacterium]|nr:hypothetical protein [Acidobacteriota bacterium]
CGASLRFTPEEPPALPPDEEPITRSAPLNDLIGRPLPPKAPNQSRTGAPMLPVILGGAALLLGAVILFFLITWNQESRAEAENTLARLDSIDQSLELINRRLEQTDGKVAALQSETQVMKEHMGLTEAELKRAQALARQLQQEQARNVSLLTQQISAKADAEKVDTLKQEAETKIAGVSEDVDEVREEIRSGQEELSKTKEELARLGVLINEQGTMIATNASGLEELRRRGERDYLPFDIRKKQRMTVAGISLELRKADVKKQYADFRLYIDDRVMEQKQVYVNRPVTFYAGRNRMLYEVVINEVRKDQMLGYVSTPKAGTTAVSAR